MHLEAATSRGPILFHDRWILKLLRFPENTVLCNTTIHTHNFFLWNTGLHWAAASSLVHHILLIYFFKLNHLVGAVGELWIQINNRLFEKGGGRGWRQWRRSRRTELNYLHLEIQTQQGWSYLHNSLCSFDGDSVVPCSKTLNACSCIIITNVCICVTNVIGIVC